MKELENILPLLGQLLEEISASNPLLRTLRKKSALLEKEYLSLSRKERRIAAAKRGRK